MTIFGIDASSAQGNVNWAAVDETTAFGAEKVSEGTGYVNPFWASAKAEMTARALTSGFLPIAYHFTDAGDGTAQADHFAAAAGNLDGWGIAVDLERAPNGSPSLGEARAAVARLRQHYPGHPVGGYAPHWYVGNGDVSFFDWLWASNYVTAAGAAPAALYGHVAAAQWAAYGGEQVTLLQFTDAAIVPGAAGRVDCSAFRGAPAALRAIIAPRPAPHPEGPAVTEHVTQGNQSLARLCRQHGHGATPAMVLRLTAQHSPGHVYPGNVAAWINDLFNGVRDAQATVPAGLHLYLPAGS